ncbi:hypothetical protein Ae201684P_013686 [Aphanomyces euteiches]|uniref:Uncharacterized protein n=1 Tax=Aphanomyces euteiches TaxID=100861 RepID=A0A6G0W7J1_9STRA|nr:hypothetical protein Ae201684_018411 [Aphanomyces euteiches]KAH9095095.1 hypothetical protein Ae201684P_013686 [Aphanomyces euteiches]
MKKSPSVPSGGLSLQKISKASPVCLIRPGYTSYDYGSLNFTEFIAELRRYGKSLGGDAAPSSTNGTVTTPVPGYSSSSVATSSSTTAAPTTTKGAPSSALSCLALSFALQ